MLSAQIPLRGANPDQKWAHHSVGCPEDALIHGFNSSQLSWCYAGLYSMPIMRTGAR